MSHDSFTPSLIGRLRPSLYLSAEPSSCAQQASPAARNAPAADPLHDAPSRAGVAHVTLDIAFVAAVWLVIGALIWAVA